MGGWRATTGALIALGLMLGACGGEPATGPAASGEQTTTGTDDPAGGPTEEVVFARFGGLCPDGACRFELTLSEDGSWSLTQQLKLVEEGEIAASDAVSLIEDVDAVWDVLSAEDFTGTCPTAYDGQELILMRTTYPNDPLADAARSVTSSCRYVWPDAPTEALRAAVSEAGLPGW